MSGQIFVIPQKPHLLRIPAGLWLLVSILFLLAVVGVSGIEIRYFGEHFNGTIEIKEGIETVFDTDQWPSDRQVNKIGEITCFRIRLQESLHFPIREQVYYRIMVWKDGGYLAAADVHEWIPKLEAIWDIDIGERIDEQSGSLPVVYYDRERPPKIIYRGYVCMALLPLVSGAFIWSLVWWLIVLFVRRRKRRRRRALSRGLCPLCNYEIRGLAQPRCPECGATWDWSNTTHLY